MSILSIIFRVRQIKNFFCVFLAVSEPENRMFFGVFLLLGASISIRSLQTFINLDMKGPNATKIAPSPNKNCFLRPPPQKKACSHQRKAIGSGQFLET